MAKALDSSVVSVKVKLIKKQRQIAFIGHVSHQAPETLIFNRFAESWNNMKRDEFRSSPDDPIVKLKISDDECEQIKQFCRRKIQQTQMRGDYEELLELTITFLGDNCGAFRTCGAISYARFMSKAIYWLKFFLFRSQFKLAASELNCIRDKKFLSLNFILRSVTDARILLNALIRI